MAGTLRSFSPNARRMGEKDRVRGFGRWRLYSNFRTPSPQPSPLGGEGVRCASFCGLAWQALSFSRCVSAPEFFLRAERSARLQNVVTSIAKPVRSKERAGVGLSFGLPFELRSIKLQEINEGSGTPANAGYHRRILRCGARSYGARTLDGVPPRLSPKGVISSQRLSFRPGFLGRGLNGRYPPSPVPVQGCTSRPGHNAGGLIPKPPGSRLQTRPRAPPSLP